MRIKFLVDKGEFKAGSVAEVLPKAAMQMIEDGDAVEVYKYTVCMKNTEGYVGCISPADVAGKESARDAVTDTDTEEPLKGESKDEYEARIMTSTDGMHSIDKRKK